MVQCVIHGLSPYNRLFAASLLQRWEKDVFLPYPDKHLTDSLQLRKSGKYQSYGFAHAPIRNHLYPVYFAFHITDGNCKKQLTPTSLLLYRLHRTLTKNGNLHFTHRPFHAQKQPVIGQTWVINSVFVNDESSDEPAKLQQSMPVASITGEA